MKDDITVLEIILDYLIEHGYNGLVSNDGECGCTLDYFAPCIDNKLGGIHSCHPRYLKTTVKGIVPIKSSGINSEIIKFHCGNCNSTNIQITNNKGDCRYYKFCPDCGAKVNWNSLVK